MAQMWIKPFKESSAGLLHTASCVLHIIQNDDKAGNLKFIHVIEFTVNIYQHFPVFPARGQGIMEISPYLM